MEMVRAGLLHVLLQRSGVGLGAGEIAGVEVCAELLQRGEKILAGLLTALLDGILRALRALRALPGGRGKE